MQAAPPLLSFLLIFLHYSGWTHGLCKLENSTVAWCEQLEDLGQIETYHLETLTAPTAQETLIPGLFDNLTSLRHLDMSGGDLKTIEPGSFRALSNLRSLDLSNNRIEYLELASLEGLTDLRKLNLRNNAIRQLPPALARLKHLRHLDVHDNPLDCNCATLKVRDLIVLRKVSVSKKVVCANPSSLKGASLMKPNAAIICGFEQQDREMQNDQAVEGSGMYSGSGDDILIELSEEENNEDVGINGSSEKPEVETLLSTGKLSSSTGSPVIEPTISSQESTTAVEETTSITINSLQATVEDEEIFFESEEKKEQISTTEMLPKKEDFKDALFYPSTGSGDGDDDGSGEGSGTILTHYDEEKIGKDSANEESSSPFSTLWDYIFGSAVTTAIPSETKDPDLEEEEFIDVSSTKLATEESIESSERSSVKSEIDKTVTETIATTSDVEVLKSADKSKLGAKAEVNSLNDEQAEVSPAKQSKKGMGSYIVLAILLAVVATLIGFAAYRGDICRKKRKRGNDVERGTELRDMQKSLLPDTGNSTQPKIASNGNPENVPLVEGPSDGDDAKIDKTQSDHHPIQETPRSLNGTADHLDPVKPPRKLISSQDDEKSEDRPRVDINSLRENFLADRTSPTQPSDSSLATSNGPKAHISEPNGPPLSPGAQRVKITLQENPDSVPKTPILITRTMAGENLVKTP